MNTFTRLSKYCNPVLRLFQQKYGFERNKMFHPNSEPSRLMLLLFLREQEAKSLRFKIVFSATHPTKDPVVAYVFINVMKVASGLEVSSVGVEVVMRHSLLDAHA